MATTKIPAEFLSINAIQGTLIADNAITTVHIAQNAITSVQIPNNSIGTVQIALNTVTSTHIAQNQITTIQLANNSVQTLNIADDQVTADKLAADAVVTASIVDLNVTEGKIAANAITASKIPDGSITATQIGANAVTLAKMASLARGSILLGNSAADVSALAIGSNGYVLKSDGTDAAWAVDATVAALTTEQVQDIAGAMFSSNTETGISVTYQDGDGTLDLVIGDDTIVSSMLDTNIDIAGTLDVTGVLTTDTNAVIAGTLGIAGSSTNGVAISQGAIAIKNGGSKSYIDLYCESSNAHYAALQPQPHASGVSPTVTLPKYTGTLVADTTFVGAVDTVSGDGSSTDVVNVGVDTLVVAGTANEIELSTGINFMPKLPVSSKLEKEKANLNDWSGLH